MRSIPNTLIPPLDPKGKQPPLMFKKQTMSFYGNKVHYQEDHFFAGKLVLHDVC